MESGPTFDQLPIDKHELVRLNFALKRRGYRPFAASILLGFRPLRHGLVAKAAVTAGMGRYSRRTMPAAGFHMASKDRRMPGAAQWDCVYVAAESR
ncbi:hypothetical protein C3941_05155 [Kaistia algarum]|nr:hypothetical protein C3941_05155 [Kaistia algarum]